MELPSQILCSVARPITCLSTGMIYEEKNGKQAWPLSVATKIFCTKKWKQEPWKNNVVLLYPTMITLKPMV